MLTGRFAPSPSGRMHLGNVFSALLAWLSVRSRGGRMLLRIEDLDPDRCRPEYAKTLKRDLDWLGLDWDAEQTPSRAGRRPTARSLTSWRRLDWSIPATAPGRSCTRPPRRTRRTVRSSTPGPAGT